MNLSFGERRKEGMVARRSEFTNEITDLNEVDEGEEQGRLIA